jgi:hypothetical protein
LFRIPVYVADQTSDRRNLQSGWLAMAQDGGGNTGLAMIVGGLVVLVALFFFFGGVDIFSGGDGGGAPDVNVTVDTPAAPAPAN